MASVANLTHTTYTPPATPLSPSKAAPAPEVTSTVSQALLDPNRAGLSPLPAGRESGHALATRETERSDELLNGAARGPVSVGGQQLDPKDIYSEVGNRATQRYSAALRKLGLDGPIDRAAYRMEEQFKQTPAYKKMSQDEQEREFARFCAQSAQQFAQDPAAFLKANGGNPNTPIDPVLLKHVADGSRQTLKALDQQRSLGRPFNNSPDGVERAGELLFPGLPDPSKKGYPG